MSTLDELREVMRRLRAPDGGCPWDREQTLATIVPHTLEEAYEVADAIECGRLEQLPGELGDLLFQVIFYCQLAEEDGRFNLDHVMRVLRDKLITRHPHVFGQTAAADADAVSQHWESLKARERASRVFGKVASELDDVPVALPALSRAAKLQKRAARVGFDWPDVAGVWAKLREELAELEAAAAGTDADATAGELGDLLFSAVNLARHLGHDAEAVLRAANRKFERRFRHVEEALRERAQTPADVDLATLDSLWDAAKRNGV